MLWFTVNLITWLFGIRIYNNLWLYEGIKYCEVFSIMNVWLSIDRDTWKVVSLSSNVWCSINVFATIIVYITSAYDKDQNLSGHSLFLTNSMKLPLIMYSKFVWPKLNWLDICLFWPESMYIHEYVCMYVCTYVYVCVCTYVRTYVCMYLYMYVRMYVCMCVCIQ